MHHSRERQLSLINDGRDATLRSALERSSTNERGLIRMLEAPMSSTAPMLTDALIDRLMREQRQQLRPPSGWGYSAWPLRAEQALATLTDEGWCELGWIERANHRLITNPVRHHVWWQVDTGEVRFEREPQTSTTMPASPG